MCICVLTQGYHVPVAEDTTSPKNTQMSPSCELQQAIILLGIAKRGQILHCKDQLMLAFAFFYRLRIMNQISWHLLLSEKAVCRLSMFPNSLMTYHVWSADGVQYIRYILYLQHADNAVGSNYPNDQMLILIQGPHLTGPCFSKILK